MNIKEAAAHVGPCRRVTAHSRKRLLTNRENTTPSLDGGRDWLPWEAEIYTKV